MEVSKRYRVNVSTSVKGIKTYECTVETTADQPDMRQVLDESDKLVKALDERYPAPVS